MENTRKKRITYAFGAHASEKELHVTVDDQMFLTASDAANHAKTLEDATVEVVKREDYVKVAPVVDNQLDLERESLVIKHKELFGKEPAKTASIDTLKKKITDEESRLAELKAKETETDKGSEEN